METILKIIMDALPLTPRNADYPELMESVMDVALQNFGFCSEEYLAFSNAWNEICVPTELPVRDEPFCDFSLSGPSTFCEESPNQSFCVVGQGGIPSTRYRFYVLGRNDSGFDSGCGMSGNSQEVPGCNCLSLNQIPEFPYYPQTIKIVAYNLDNGREYEQVKTVTIYDCDGDDLTCEEYYNVEAMTIANDDPTSFINATYASDMFSINLPDDATTLLSNPSGQVLYEGDSHEIRDFYGALPSGVYFLTVIHSKTNEIETQFLYHE